MAYIVNGTDGNVVALVSDGTLNNATSLKLIGIGYDNYAETVAENFVALLQNFASFSPPANPILGQVWYNRSALQLEIFDGVQFNPINNVQIGSGQPTSTHTGDFWYNSTTKQLNFLRGSEWHVVAPPYTADQGRSEFAVETITDNLGTPHTAIVVYVSGVRALIISNDSRYRPYPYIDQFDFISPGINIPTTYGGLFWAANGNAWSSGITVSPGGNQGSIQFNDGTGHFTGNDNIKTDGESLTVAATVYSSTTVGESVISTIFGFKFPDQTIQTTAAFNDPNAIAGSGTPSHLATFDTSSTLTSTSQITTDGTNLTVAGTVSGNTLLSTAGGIIFPDNTVQTTAATNNTNSVNGNGAPTRMAYFSDTTHITGATGISTDGINLSVTTGLLSVKDITLTNGQGGKITFADGSVQTTAARNFSQVQSDWNITDNTQTSFIKNKPTNIQISYPTSIISNSNFSWGVISGIPNETWYATTNLPAPYNRIPSSGTYPLDSNGATSYTNGYFGNNTGDVEVTFNFSQSGKIIKRLNIISSTQISYPTVVPTSSSNFRWRIFNGYPNDSWYATYGPTSNPTQFRVPATGTNSLDSLGQISYTNGSFPGITGPADVEVIFYFTLSGIVIKRVYVLG